MRHISDIVRERLMADPRMKVCMRNMALRDHVCDGRITFEHALIYAGRQMDEVFAIISLCAYSHSVDRFQDNHVYNRQISEWIAINRMTPADEARYPRGDWAQRRKHLNGVFGLLTPSVV